MDGASKFVRGDAVAGIIILLINIFGGLIVGVLQHDMDIASAAKVYTLLTIGDGLVAQIPALIISTAAGLVVSRVSTDQNTGQQLMTQLLAKPQALALTGAIIGIMGMVPGMPHFAFMLLAAAFVGIAYYVHQRDAAQKAVEQTAAVGKPVAETHDVSWSDVMPVDTLGLEVGYRLIPLVDKDQDGELLRRIKAIRRKFAQEIGFLPPAMHIRDNLELRPNGYRITLKGVEIGEHESHAGMFLAINPGRVTAQLAGTATVDPAFGLPAVWIDAAMRDQAQQWGYTVVDAGTVVATHFSQLIHNHAAELLGRQELQQLVDHLSREIAQARRRRGAQTAADGDAAARAAEPARRGRAHPRHAHHHRSRCRPRRRARRTPASSPRWCASRSAARSCSRSSRAKPSCRS